MHAFFLRYFQKITNVRNFRTILISIFSKFNKKNCFSCINLINSKASERSHSEESFFNSGYIFYLSIFKIQLKLIKFKTILNIY